MKKFITYSLILAIFLTGVFGNTSYVQAQAESRGLCVIVFTGEGGRTQNVENQTRTQCLGSNAPENSNTVSLPGSRITWTPYATSGTDPSTIGSTTTSAPTEKEKTPFEKAVDDHCQSIADASLGSCLVQLFYFLFYVVPGFLLSLAAKFLNMIVALSLSQKMYDVPFIGNAWTVVRDLSNVFFIVILLYVAIKMILGLGGHDTKKMIGQVVIMALLINFSLFFTKIIIDSSNVLGLIFYNRIAIEHVSKSENVGYLPSLNGAGVEDKDIAGGIASGFNVTKIMGEEFFEQARERTGIGFVSGATALGAGGAAALVFGGPVGLVVGGVGLLMAFLGSDQVPPTLLVSILIPAGIIMYYAIYVFFTAGIAFVSRIIELWIHMIFAPFAFMSSALPALKHLPGIGWDQWLKRLIEVAFMAPIFMFFLYLIFKIIEADITKGLLTRADQEQQHLVETIILVVIPALIILGLLKQASKYAQKASGEIGAAVLGGVKAAGTLAIGGGFAATALAGRSTIRAFMKGASTGDTAANRMVGSHARIAAHQAVINDPNSTIVQRTQARKEIARERMDQIKGNISNALRIQAAQNWVGHRINQDQQNVEHSAHARHELDSTASDITHGKKKKWDDLNGQERYEARRKLARDRAVRQYSDPATAGTLLDPTTGILYGGFGTRGWDKLSPAEQAAIDRSATVGNDPDTDHAIPGGALATNTTHADQHEIPLARVQQGAVSNFMQASVTGTYDARRIAEIIAKENSTAMNKVAAGLLSTSASLMRSGIKGLGFEVGKGSGNFFADLRETIGDAMKHATINVDLGHAGEEKKDDGHGHGGGHH